MFRAVAELEPELEMKFKVYCAKVRKKQRHVMRTLIEKWVKEQERKEK